MSLLRFAAAVIALALAMSAPTFARAQSAEDRAAAHAEFERGVAAYTAREYRTALDAFQEAYRLAPHASVRLNIANCYDQLDRPVEALFHFEHYLTEASGLTAAQRREVQATIARLEARVGTITLAVTPDGATITIDGADTRRAPVSEPVRVVAGDHSVDITLDGYVAEHQTVHVDGGGNVRVAIRLRRAEAVAAGGGAAGAATGAGTGPSVGTDAGAAAASGGAGSGTTDTAATATPTEASPDTAVATTAEPTGPDEGAGAVAATPDPHGETPGGGGDVQLGAPFWIAASVTAAALVGWVIAGSIALSENSLFEEDVRVANDPTYDPIDMEAARNSGYAHADNARAAALAADVLLVTTLVGAGATTFFLVLDLTEGGQGEGESASLRVAPVVGPGLVGVSAVGSF